MKKQMNFNIDPKLYKQFKKIMIDKDTTVTEELTKYIEDSLNKNKFENFIILISNELNKLNLKFEIINDKVYDKIFKLNDILICLSECYNEINISKEINIDLVFTKENSDEESLLFYIGKQYASISSNFPVYYKNINNSSDIQKEVIKLIGCITGIINLEKGNVILCSKVKYKDIPLEEELNNLIDNDIINL